MLNFLLIAWIAPCFWDKNVGVGLVTPLTNRRCDPEHAKLWEISGRRITAYLKDGRGFLQWCRMMLFWLSLGTFRVWNGSTVLMLGAWGAGWYNGRLDWCDLAAFTAIRFVREWHMWLSWQKDSSTTLIAFEVQWNNYEHINSFMVPFALPGRQSWNRRYLKGVKRHGGQNFRAGWWPWEISGRSLVTFLTSINRKRTWAVTPMLFIQNLDKSTEWTREICSIHSIFRIDMSRCSHQARREVGQSH